MKLISLWIDRYKNLHDANIEFSGTSIPMAVIGNNGTGKSNLLEAILTIFIKIYFGEPPDFLFKIVYVAHAKHVEICRNSFSSGCSVIVDGLSMSTNRLKELAQSPILRPPFPELIFGYYSGTCKRLTQLFGRYERHYARKLRSEKTGLERSFIFSDAEQAKLILLALLAHKHFTFLAETSILCLDRLTITLQTPKTFDPEEDDPEFWGATGIIRLFLADLEYSAIEKKESRVLDRDGTTTKSKEQRRYTFDQVTLEKLGNWSRSRGTSVFSMLQTLKMKNVLLEAKFTLTHVDKTTLFNFEDLSEGEKQLISVIGGLYLTNQHECLVLLDEPDTHLNPAWTWKYNSLLKNAINQEQENRSSVLITTHNPILISGLTKDQVLIAHKGNNQLTYTHPYRDPRGQGVANVLTSEFFGLPSSLDEHTQSLMDERLKLAFKDGRLTRVENARLKEINDYLDHLGLSISFRDPEYGEYEASKYRRK